MNPLEQAQRWFEQDPDEETKAELEALIQSAGAGSAEAEAELVQRFGSRLAFGTAGLRGELGAGTNRMNRVLVSQAAAGLAAWLNQQEITGPVVIGYDGRKNSQIFAQDSAEILAGSGRAVILLPKMLPTPVLAFAVKHYQAAAGINVTASHNPPNDNGYKVYLPASQGGGQIIPPVDSEIAEAIDAASLGDIRDLPRSSNYEIADLSVIEAYISRTAAIAAPQAEPLSWVYTAMHGVGWETFERVLSTAGYQLPVTVDAQRDPDPLFSTVAFPNPEEPGALDLAFETARATGAELIIAHDPDADRLGAAIPSAEAPEGYRRLSGNEVGVLLGWAAAEQAREHGSYGTLAASLVSSPALGAIAKEYSLGYAETLTGFKWIVKVPELLYGYEEALGYLVNPDTVSDKDGISAALRLLEIASALKAEGKTIADRLAEFAERFGYYFSDQLSLRVDDLSLLAASTARLRSEPPATIGGIGVTRADDLNSPADGSPASDVLRYQLADGSRVIVRPSGTEPKLKIYFDVTAEADGATPPAVIAQQKLKLLAEDMSALISL